MKIFQESTYHFHIQRDMMEQEGITGELHLHLQDEACNDFCLFFINGIRTRRSSFAVLANIKTSGAKVDRTECPGKNLGPAFNIAIQSADNDYREETTMQAEYDVSKLKEALEAKKAELEADLIDRAEWTQAKVAEYLAEERERFTPFEDLETFLREAWRSPGSKQERAQHDIRTIERSLEKLNLVSTETVTLADNEYADLGL